MNFFRKGHTKSRRRISKNQLLLFFYDFLLFAGICALISFGLLHAPFAEAALSAAVGAGCIFLSRLFFRVYRQIWRYGGMQPYIRLLIADAVGGAVYALLGHFVLRGVPLGTLLIFSAVAINLIICMAARMTYHYAYQYSSRKSRYSRLVRGVLRLLGHMDVKYENAPYANRTRIKIAIVGAGHVGAALAEEMKNNEGAIYEPVCFIDRDADKIGRAICDIPVLGEEAITAELLSDFSVQEIVIALPHLSGDEKKALYDRYRTFGLKLLVYDYPTMQSVGSGKRTLREFDIEELLFRKQQDFINEKTAAYYRGKVILITGGGGSIGSELCRQIARMSPKKLVILDICENGAYDIQQELQMGYQQKLDLAVEICSVCDRRGLEKVFATYRPQIVINAAAHKHVPLMEHNAVEAVKNNVFGTKNTVELSEEYGAERVMMVSTDKAVNPTNVMGATKRMCEMIFRSHSNGGSSTTFSATRFGNVLGSAGSVIPLFRRQIAAGGPLTLTDRRIIRYFMTIPEASQLVLTSGAMAKNGELFVLDMGKPVRILELAENMIRLSGYEPYTDIDIIETGLRPGEKLYEELLMKSEDLGKTENEMIFIERDEPLSPEELEEKLDVLRTAVETEDDDAVKDALRRVIPTFRSPEEVNKKAQDSDEMKACV